MPTTETSNWRDGEIISRKRLSDEKAPIRLCHITYASQGLPVQGLLAEPQRDEPCPGLLYCRGGIGRVGMVQPERIEALAAHGYVVFAPYYRGSASGGHGTDEFGGEDRRDVYNALTLMRSLPGVAPLPVPLIGFSRGSIMAALAARDCPLAGPIVVWGGVSDLLLTYEERIDLRRMLKRVVGHPVKHAAAYHDRSPVCWAEQIRCPVLIVHGDQDDQVSIEHARRLAEQLEIHGKDFTVAVYEGMKHRFPPEVDAAALAQIDRWIRGKLNYPAKLLQQHE